jgi:hypothetical protein
LIDKKGYAEVRVLLVRTQRRYERLIMEEMRKPVYIFRKRDIEET